MKLVGINKQLLEWAPEGQVAGPCHMSHQLLTDLQNPGIPLSPALPQKPYQGRVLTTFIECNPPREQVWFLVRLHPGAEQLIRTQWFSFSQLWFLSLGSTLSFAPSGLSPSDLRMTARSCPVSRLPLVLQEGECPSIPCKSAEPASDWTDSGHMSSPETAAPGSGRR